jgi:uncharacterized protein YceK
VNSLLLTAYATHGMFDDMVHSLGRGLMWAGAFRIMHGLSLPGAALLVTVVLAIAWMASRR